MSPAERIDAFLIRYETAFTESFRQVLTTVPPADTAYGQVWFQADDIADCLPLTLFWCDQQHGCKQAQPPNLHVPTDQPLWPTDGLDDAVFGTLVFSWVRRCWLAAGGASSFVSFYA